MNIILIIIYTWSESDLEKIHLRDPAVFERIYNEHKLKLYNFLIVRVNGDNHLAEEILSDTICSALISAPKLKNKDKISSWLFQIANRRFYDYLRKKYKNKKIQEAVKNNIPETGEKEPDDDEKVVIMKTAMEKLKPLYKELIKLKYIDNKSQIEIADHLNKSRLSVESLLFRAREVLKKEINKIYQEAL